MALDKVGARILMDTESALLALKKLCSWADKLHLAYAWTHSDGGKADHWAALDLDKVKRALIGIRYAHTEPEALKRLSALPGVLKVVGGPWSGDVFHPKVILGVRADGRARVLLGSSNLNGGGFGGNTELNILLSGREEEEPINSVTRFLDEQWKRDDCYDLDAEDEEWFAWYEEQQTRRPKQPGPDGLQPGPVDLDVGWSQYFGLLRRHHSRLLWNGWKMYVFHRRDGNSCLQEIAACARAFKTAGSFRGMGDEDRKLVAGFGPDTTGHFGSMAGAGTFMNLVNEAPARIGKYLDHIPLNGSVTTALLEQYFRVVDEVDGMDLPTATRLLTMKRPDQFVSVNKGSRPGIRRVFGSAPYSVSGYLRLLKRIRSFPWFNAPKPEGTLELQVWAARVALLDAVFYEPVR